MKVLLHLSSMLIGPSLYIATYIIWCVKNVHIIDHNQSPMDVKYIYLSIYHVVPKRLSQQGIYWDIMKLVLCIPSYKQFLHILCMSRAYCFSFVPPLNFFTSHLILGSQCEVLFFQSYIVINPTHGNPNRKWSNHAK